MAKWMIMTWNELNNNSPNKEFGHKYVNIMKSSIISTEYTAH